MRFVSMATLLGTAVSVSATPALLAQPVVEVIDQSVSIDLSYTMGWGPEVFEDEAIVTTRAAVPISAQLDDFQANPDYLTFGPQQTSIMTTGEASLEYDLSGPFVGFTASNSGTAFAEANGSLSSSLVTVGVLTNNAFFDFQVLGAPVNYTITFETLDQTGSARLSGDNSVFVNLVTNGTRTGTLQPGVYRLRGSYAIGAFASDTTGTQDSEAGGFTVSIEFEGALVNPFICPADANGDGDVTPADFNAWVLAFNNQAPTCDQNDDGLCTPADFNAWVLNFNNGC
ncbi:MAG: GC-type dockerin domain-anchored protein [Planctomycetota bacterium]